MNTKLHLYYFAIFIILSELCFCTNIHSEIAIAVPVYKNNQISSIVVVFQNETTSYKKIIKRQCWNINVNHNSCNIIMNIAKNQLESKDWTSICVIPLDKCAEIVVQLSNRLFEFTTPYENYYGYSNDDNSSILQDSSIISLQKLKNLLIDKKCFDNTAMRSFYNYIENNFDDIMIHHWRRPYLGVWRDVDNSAIPCNSAFWVKGNWQLQPMWSHATKDVSVAKCAEDMQEIESPCSHADGLLNKCQMNWQTVCRSLIFPSIQRSIQENDISPSDKHELHPTDTDTVHPSCLVYTFGRLVLGSFEKYIASDGQCEVHAFDSSEHFLEMHRGLNSEYPNVHFHHIGQKQKHGSRLEMILQGVNGHWSDSALPLDRIMTSFNHQNRSLNVVKIDCDGCEWKTLHHLAKESSTLLDNVCNFLLDLELSKDTIRGYDDLGYVAFFVEEYLVRRGFKLWFRHVEVDGDADMPCKLHPLLIDLGFPTSVCKYQIAIHNSKCLGPSSKEGGEAYEWLDGHSSQDGVNKQATMYRTKNHAIVNTFMGSSNSLTTFSERYNYIYQSNLTVALVQFSPYIHSEIIGPFVTLCESAGFRNIIIYNDIYHKDNTEVIHESMVPLFKHWKEWIIRPTARCFEDHLEWNYMIILTGDDAYRHSKYVFESIQLHKTRIIAVQHHPLWILPDFYNKNILLTPISGGSPDHVIPFMDLEVDTAITVATCGELDAKGYSCVNSSTGGTEMLAYIHDFDAFLNRNCVLILGDIGATETDHLSSTSDFTSSQYGNDSSSSSSSRKIKDRRDIVRFLFDDVDNVVINVARDISHFLAVTALFPNQTIGLNNIPNGDLMYILQRVNFIWLPIAEDSMYVTGSFASSIAFAFAFQKILIVPKYVASLYGVEHFVLSYQHSILEIDLLQYMVKDSINGTKSYGKTLQLMQQCMIRWEHSQRIQNVLNFYEIMAS